MTKTRTRYTRVCTGVAGLPRRAKRSTSALLHSPPPPSPPVQVHHGSHLHKVGLATPLTTALLSLRAARRSNLPALDSFLHAFRPGLTVSPLTGTS